MEHPIQPQSASADNSAKSSITITEPALKFTLFPKLPIELRLKIWKAALPGPRILRIVMIPSFTRVVTQEKKSEDEYVSITTNKFKLSFKTNDHMIMLLHVCSESRDVVRKKYPIQLPMERFADQDVRMNSFDILSIANLSDLLRDLEQAKENKLAIPPFISTIDKLAWVSQYNHQYHDHDPTQLVTITRMDRYRAPPLLSLPRSLQRFPGFGDARFCASLTDLHKNGSLDLLPRLKQILLVADEDRSTVESDFSSFAEVGVLDSSNEKAYDPASSFVRAVLTWKDIYRSLEQNKIQLDWEVPEMKIFVKNIARHVSDTNESYDHLNCARLATRTK